MDTSKENKRDFARELKHVPINEAHGITLTVDNLKANGATRRIWPALHHSLVHIEQSHRASGDALLVQ